MPAMPNAEPVQTAPSAANAIVRIGPFGNPSAFVKRSKGPRRGVVPRDAFTPRADPDDARAIAQHRADAIRGNRGVERRIALQTVDDLQRPRIDDVDAAAERGEPDLAVRHFRDAVDP